MAKTRKEGDKTESQSVNQQISIKIGVKLPLSGESQEGDLQKLFDQLEQIKKVLSSSSRESEEESESTDTEVLSDEAIWEEYFEPFQEFAQTMQNETLQDQARGILLDLAEAKRNKKLGNPEFQQKLKEAKQIFEEAPKIEKKPKTFEEIRSELSSLSSSLKDPEDISAIRTALLDLIDAKRNDELSPELISEFEVFLSEMNKRPKKTKTKESQTSEKTEESSSGTEDSSDTENAPPQQQESVSEQVPKVEEPESFDKLPVVMARLGQFSPTVFTQIIPDNAEQEEKDVIKGLSTSMKAFQKVYMNYINESNTVNGAPKAPGVFEMEHLLSFFKEVLPGEINKLRVEFDTRLPKKARFYQKDMFVAYRDSEKAVKKELAGMMGQIEKGQKSIQSRINAKRLQEKQAEALSDKTDTKKSKLLGLDSFVQDQEQQEAPDQRDFTEQYGSQLRRYQSTINYLSNLLRSELGVKPTETLPKPKKVEGKTSTEVTKEDEAKAELYRDFQRDFSDVPAHIEEEYKEWNDKELLKRTNQSELDRFKNAKKYNLKLTKADFRDYIAKENQKTLQKSVSQFTEEEKEKLILERTHDLFIEYHFSDKTGTSIAKDKEAGKAKNTWKSKTDEIFKLIYGNWQIAQLYMDPSKNTEIPLAKKDEQVKRRLPLIRENIFLMKQQLVQYRKENPDKGEALPSEIGNLGVMAKELQDWTIADQQKKYFSTIIQPEQQSFSDKVKEKFTIKSAPKQESKPLSESELTDQSVQLKAPQKSGVFKKKFKIK